MMTKIYPRTGDQQTVYLNAVIKDPQIEVGDYTIYNDFIADPLLFEKNNVLYHYPIHREKLIIGKFCSIACGTKFLFNCANHTLKSLSTYTFPLFYEEWELEKSNITTAWDNKGNSGFEQLFNLKFGSIYDKIGKVFTRKPYNLTKTLDALRNTITREDRKRKNK